MVSSENLASGICQFSKANRDEKVTRDDAKTRPKNGGGILALKNKRVILALMKVFLFMFLLYKAIK